MYAAREAYAATETYAPHEAYVAPAHVPPPYVPPAYAAQPYEPFGPPQPYEPYEPQSPESYEPQSSQSFGPPQPYEPYEQQPPQPYEPPSPYGQYGPPYDPPSSPHGAYGPPEPFPRPAYASSEPSYDPATLITPYAPPFSQPSQQSPQPQPPLLPRQHGARSARGGQGERRASPRRIPRRRRSSRPAPSPDVLRKLLPQALVVAFLAGGTSAFVASDKAIKLSVDGVPRTMHTFADGVDDLLEEQGLAVGAHDIVAPAPGAGLASGDEVIVRHGRPVLLTLDGQQRRLWTTADTVDGALRQLGVRAEGAFLSVSRSSAIGRTGLALHVRTERSVTFMADGREHTIRTNAATVGQALTEAGIELRGQDTTSVPAGSFPRDGQTVTVMRITGSQEVREEVIPYDTVKTSDASLFKGTEIVAQQGAHGTRRVTYALRTVNGVKQKPRRLRQETVRLPVTERIRVGTKARPTSVAGADGLNWSALAACESGGRAGAVDASGNFGGLYQFDTRTWHALGGTGRPQDASPSEQTFRAKMLYVRRGASPWPHCGRRLTG
ncbi:ubiquitin-like domain-containing protein [Streptomyces sp. NPDC088725]|uniref:ubiquitin-like domain-containing protein n=1 Tax=Streptomyces sp. NPDC088725 TaxID=3365873 RepID=UPI0038268E0B